MKETLQVAAPAVPKKIKIVCGSYGKYQRRMRAYYEEVKKRLSKLHERIIFEPTNADETKDKAVMEAFYQVDNMIGVWECMHGFKSRPFNPEIVGKLQQFKNVVRYDLRSRINAIISNSWYDFSATCSQIDDLVDSMEMNAAIELARM